jgi:hypothetical protein
MVVEFTTTCAIIAYHHLLILMEFMIITVYNWFAESRFFVGVHWMEFADTTLGISEQYLFFCALHTQTFDPSFVHWRLI